MLMGGRCAYKRISSYSVLISEVSWDLYFPFLNLFWVASGSIVDELVAWDGIKVQVQEKDHLPYSSGYHDGHLEEKE